MKKAALIILLGLLPINLNALDYHSGPSDRPIGSLVWPEMKSSINICQVDKWNVDLGVTHESFQAYDSSSMTFITPTQKLNPKDYPYFEDDLDFELMHEVIDRQIERYKNRNMRGFIRLGEETFHLSQIKRSLKAFRVLVDSHKKCLKSKKNTDCNAKLNRKVRNRFYVYAPKLKEGDPRYGEEKPVLFTGYYTPTLRGQYEPSEEFPHAIYARPSDEKSIATPRVDIDFRGGLLGRGLELFYTQDLFELYLLHVQGGGRVITQNEHGEASSYYISYDGQNGLSWRFISHYMREQGMIQDGSVRSQRNYLKENPDKQEEIYSTCPSYVYFKTSDHPPVGSDMVPLTNNRSIATDRNFYRFKGMLSFVKAQRPLEDTDDEACDEVQFKNFSRFYLDQDTGGAIRGKGRVDLFFGEDKYAEIAAYNTVQRGELYFLMLKQ